MYDIGDADGLPFLTMEYVDGEDLSTLRRHIGRRPEDKALDIARQLCAGLTAAHERGVLHRERVDPEDLYALGLVLYEVFTGRRAFGAQTVAELVRQHQDGTITPPSTLVRDPQPQRLGGGYSLRERRRTSMRRGVPTKPNFSRSWFKRKRW